MGTPAAHGAISFDLFGTVVDVRNPTAPAAAVATELERRGVAVPDDWREAYLESHIDAPDGREVPLPAHVDAALKSRGVDVNGATGGNGPLLHQAVLAAFDSKVHTREGAVEAVDAAAARGPVGILSNCSVPGLVHRTLDRSGLEEGLLDVIVSSVDCGWRKPHRRAFDAVATRLGVPLARLVHVGDTPTTDGGGAEVGVTTVLIDDVPLREFRAGLESGGWLP